MLISPGKWIIQSKLKTLDGKRVLHWFYMVKRVFDQVARLIPVRIRLCQLFGFSFFCKVRFSNMMDHSEMDFAIFSETDFQKVVIRTGMRCALSVRISRFTGKNMSKHGKSMQNMFSNIIFAVITNQRNSKYNAL